jgi:hypothetical protein
MCRYLFTVQVPARGGGPAEGWEVEAECPSCEATARFTIDDTPDRQPERRAFEPDPEGQKAIDRLFEPIDRNRSHPAAGWFDRIANGFFDDDRGSPRWQEPWWVFRFRRGDEAAYLWLERDRCFLRPWGPMDGRGVPPVRDVPSFEAGLDELAGS